MAAKQKHIVDIRQFKKPDVLGATLSLADEMETMVRLMDDIVDLQNKPSLIRGDKDRMTELTHQFEGASKKLRLPDWPRKRVMGSTFYEPSTRTRWSFERAMGLLGGETISTESAKQFSSAAKGESIADTYRVLGRYRIDCFTIRHYDTGSAEEAARYSAVPIINAGDGTDQHPTQTLLDMQTIKKKLGRMDGLKVAMVGDLSKGRTVHSLTYILAHRKDIYIYFVSPEEARMPKRITKYLRQKGIAFEETERIKKPAGVADVLYVTRVQKERMDAEQYERIKGAYVVGDDIYGLLKRSAIVMHPLPRVGEIPETEKIDYHPQSAFFDQAENGLFVRMALLKMVLTNDHGIHGWEKSYNRRTK